MIGIVAHTARAEQALTLAQTLGAYINIDDGTLGCDGNHKKVWAHLYNETSDDWLIVLEDDAVPVDDFLTQAEAALAAAPTPVVSFYLGRHHIPTIDWEQRKQEAILRADIADAHWITTNHLLHAVAVAIRRDYLVSMYRHLETLPLVLPIDEAITHWMHNRGVAMSYTWPSLVDHADQPTLFRHPDKLPRPPGRVAYRTGTHTTWTDKAVTM
jgi:GR25 family glycosyltransferase involved in LPS biosynthesis